MHHELDSGTLSYYVCDCEGQRVRLLVNLHQIIACQESLFLGKEGITACFAVVQIFLS